jgi:histidinol-phosphate aminotransferase
VELKKIPLNEEFQIAQGSIGQYVNDQTVKLIFICSPNNPTGNELNGIEDILKTFSGIVVVDEAYIDFSGKESWIKRLGEYPNLIVCQTMSKARGLAAARVGIAYSSPEIIGLMNKVKPPYNVSALNQSAALEALENCDCYLRQKAQIISERERVAESLLRNKIVKKVYPSDANFLLIEVIDADGVYSALVSKGVITRNRNSVARNCIRVTIGASEENDSFLNELRLLSANY